MDFSTAVDTNRKTNRLHLFESGTEKPKEIGHVTRLVLLLASSGKAEVTRDLQGLAVGKTNPTWMGKACEGKKQAACKDSLRLSTHATVNIRKPALWLKLLTARKGTGKKDLQVLPGRARIGDVSGTYFKVYNKPRQFSPLMASFPASLQRSVPFP